MKRFFIVFICLLSLQIVKTSAAARFSNGPAISLNNTDTTFAHSANQLQTYHGTLIERRLDSIQKDVPLDYNEFVQTYIDLYAANRDEMAHVIGLSKLNRIVQYFAKRPQVQERLTVQIGRELQKILGTKDVAVLIDANHMCVSTRGITDTGSSTVTSFYEGRFLNEETKSEFLNYAGI